MHIDFVKLSKDHPTIGDGSQIKDTTFGQYVEIGSQNFIDNSNIDDYTYTGQFCFIQNSTLKRFISMAAMVRIGPTNHPYDRPAQHIFAYNGAGYGFGDPDTEFLQKRKQVKTVIGNDVWLGHDVVVQSGITIGDGAVIGAGAVVTKDVEPYTIIGGIPGKKIKDRFSDEIKTDLEKIAWWDWSREDLEKYYQDFRLPIEEFVKKHS
ncbi:DapH/DapD/GlmU-related protein [Secundilactobacillus similis DSM 23365 = JCM 2765]|jgi:phosphonate metabolism protein (transferase hexapeptide repeat family)|uniref:Phosphonate metabolism protein n=1 Tax=Secundilactobacillus similis DSM 23365 = JCM 2765 TaxID=1423804 RepID=A0A0R2FCD8_9LACO|nr:DapH/DapD/GlmU-related protein [Secundilactobacillus similis]KRN25806.1 phosphonate metabolism protein [Secundilactobacillus similis DSM 23365 = JCM 2765]